ncbi:hypothetical protein ACB092_04G135900 [Castanea dentata]
MERDSSINKQTSFPILTPPPNNVLFYPRLSLSLSNTNTLVFCIWPPAQHMDDAVVARLVKTLSKQSILSKRYGTLPSDEASSAVRLIEEEVYSCEISCKMLDTTRASSATASSVVDIGTAPQTPSLKAASATAASEDNSPTVTES